MSTHTHIQTRRLATIAAVALAGLLSYPPRYTAARDVAATIAPASFAWAGIYDMTAIGYPDGERKAVMHVARVDTTYSLVSLQGPPGTLMRFHVSGDSAHVVWNLGTNMMVVDLRGAGDSLTGEWSSGDWSGTVRGFRRR